MISSCVEAYLSQSDNSKLLENNSLSSPLKKKKTTKMVNYFIYAKDFSGSTCGVEYYHSNGMKTVEQFKKDVERIKQELLAAGDSTESKVIYLHWGDDCYEIDEEITKLAYDELQSGNMGTEPETIIKWIQQNYDSDDNIKIKLLYIITDGLINSRSAQTCFELNKNMHYETFVFHAFNEDLFDIDLSVASSFLKSRCMIYRNYELFDNVEISEEFDYAKINLDNFETEKEKIKSYIKLKYINKFKDDVLALQEIDKLKKLRNRLFTELSSEQDIDMFDVNLETKEKNKFIHAFRNTDWYRNLYGSSQESKVEIEKSITAFINYIVSDSKSYSFDALKFDTEFNNPIREQPIVDVNFAAEQEVEFPDIILDDDKGIPVIILTKFNLFEKLIFHNNHNNQYNHRNYRNRKNYKHHKRSGRSNVGSASFSKFKSAMDCPLLLLNDPDISESIGYFYTLNVYKQLLSSTSMTEPRTRRPFNGGLVLTDTNEFDKYNDYILSATYFNARKIYYNIGLFYFVLWNNCDKKEWMDRKVVARFEKYVMRRISESKCKIGLSSLPLDPPEITSLPTALWYCVELSTIIFKDDPEHFMQERLRIYAGVAHSMLQILKSLEYDLDVEAIERRIDLNNHVTILKRIPKRREKVYYLLQKIFKNVNGFLVCEIENPLNLYTLNYLKCDHRGILKDDVIDEKVNLNDFVHMLHSVNDGRDFENHMDPVEKICDKTYRPFFTIDEKKSFYTELVTVTKKVIIENDDDKHNIKITYEEIELLEFNKVLSLYNLFINFVKESTRYPTLPEYIDYVSKKKKFNEDLVTIFPINVLNCIDCVFTRYQDITTQVDASKFIEVTKSYVKRSDRVKAEEIVKFNEEKEIDKFIVNEEVKINLKKKSN